MGRGRPAEIKLLQICLATQNAVRAREVRAAASQLSATLHNPFASLLHAIGQGRIWSISLFMRFGDYYCDFRNLHSAVGSICLSLRPAAGSCTSSIVMVAVLSDSFCRGARVSLRDIIILRARCCRRADREKDWGLSTKLQQWKESRLAAAPCNETLSVRTGRDGRCQYMDGQAHTRRGQIRTPRGEALCVCVQMVVWCVAVSVAFQKVLRRKE